MREENESPEVEAQEERPTLDGLTKLDDAGLMEVFGLNKQLEALKARIAEAQKLQGKAREHVESRLFDALTPSVSPDSMRWWIEDAQRMAKKSGKEAMEDESPSSVL